MRIIVVGAGSVGRAVTKELLQSGHEVTIIDHRAHAIRVAQIPDADWVLADACAPGVLEDVGARECDALVALTGDDKVNLVVSLIGKTEFAVPKVIARANHIENEWMYNANWGVDVVASTPRALTSLVEEAVSVGQAVQLLTLDQAATSTSVYTIELPDDSPVVGALGEDVGWPASLIVSAVVRDGSPVSLEAAGPLQGGDELIVISGRLESPAIHELQEMITSPYRLPSAGLS